MLLTVSHRFNIYSSGFVVLVLCRGDEHCQLGACFGVMFFTLKQTKTVQVETNMTE